MFGIRNLGWWGRGRFRSDEKERMEMDSEAEGRPIFHSSNDSSDQ